MHRIFTTPFAAVYPADVAKLERRSHSREELDELVDGLATGRPMEKVLR